MHLSEPLSATVKSILARHLPADVVVYAFGSRAHGRNLKPFSDLDLCVRGPARLPSDLMGALRRAFEESDLPIRVDVVDWHAISDEFRSIIEGDLITL